MRTGQAASSLKGSWEKTPTEKTFDDSWKLNAYEQYRAKLRAPDYPCFSGQSGEARGEMLYTFVAEGRLNELLTNMWEFVSLINTPAYERASLVAFFEPDPSLTDHRSFVVRFWQWKLPFHMSTNQ